MKNIKWSQWGTEGLVRFGEADYDTICSWLVDMGKEAKQSLKDSPKNHAVYGRKIFDERNNSYTVKEVRFYRDCYMTDEELEEATKKYPHSVWYVAHK